MVKEQFGRVDSSQPSPENIKDHPILKRAAEGLLEEYIKKLDKN